MPGILRFGVFELDRDAMELRRNGVPIRLQEQPLRILAALVERPGEIVTREELQERIWGKETFVDFEQSLNKAVNRLREALNDEAGQPRIRRNCSAPGIPVYRASGGIADGTTSGAAEFSHRGGAG